jgi:predicted P-loop ATPase
MTAVLPLKRETNDARRWLEQAIVDDRHRPIPILRNATLALRSAPELAEAFAYDEFERSVVVRTELPLAEGAEPRDFIPLPRALTAVDVTQVQEWLQSVGLPRIASKTVWQAIDLRARERAFHPVRNYLAGLQWDRKRRIGTWLTRYLGVESSKYSRSIGKMFLISAIARIFEPGCQCDYMLVLEGRQGLRKSTAVRILAGEEWFSDSLGDLNDERIVSQHLRGKWMIEIAELAAFNGVKVERLKAFLTKRVEKYISRYAANEVAEPRACVFIGTTNSEGYLKDETGARRFWPVLVTKVDLENLAKDRNQLFAEAVSAYREGRPRYPTEDFEQRFIRREQDARQEVDPWHDDIALFVNSRNSVFPGAIARHCLKIEGRHLSANTRDRIGAVLVKIGFKRSLKKIGDGYPYLRM